MRFPKVRTDTEKAFKMYHTLPYFTTNDVAKLFTCDRSTAYRIKVIIRAEMEKEPKKLYTDRDVIDKDVLYRVAGLNIRQIDKDYAVLMKFSS